MPLSQAKWLYINSSFLFCSLNLYVYPFIITILSYSFYLYNKSYLLSFSDLKFLFQIALAILDYLQSNINFRIYLHWIYRSILRKLIGNLPPHLFKSLKTSSHNIIYCFLQSSITSLLLDLFFIIWYFNITNWNFIMKYLLLVYIEVLLIFICYSYSVALLNLLINFVYLKILLRFWIYDYGIWIIILCQLS